MSTAAAGIAFSASGEGRNELSLALSFTRLATRGCSPGTSGESLRVITSAAETANVCSR